MLHAASESSHPQAPLPPIQPSLFSPLIRQALNYRVMTLLAALALVLIGVQAWLHLPIDAFPDISPTQTKIILKIPGMTPEEVEQRVVKPIEQELLSIPHKRIVRSLSKYGIADITLDFDEGVDIYWARQQVSERLSNVMADLPPGVNGGLAPISTPLSELYMFTIDGDQFSLAERRRVLDWVIRPQLRTIAGVAEVNSLGGEVQTFEVVPNPARMAALGVTIDDLRAALASNNSNDGAGRLQAGEAAIVVRVEGAVKTLDDVRAIRVDTVHREPAQGRRAGVVSSLSAGASDTNARKVLLDDVATVRLGALSRYGAVSFDGKGETVEGLVLGLRGVNARELVDKLDAAIETLRPQLPKGMTITTFYNRGDLVGRAAYTVIKALAEAAVLVCVVLYLFLGGLRAALVVAVSLPLSLLATFVLMGQTGITANLMSLGGLAIALGMLVDASVVVVENIETALADPRHRDESTIDLVLHATEQVAKPVAAGVLIIGVVFLPLMTLQDLEGKLFSPVAKTIVMALAASLLIAFTVIPALACVLLRRADQHQEPALMRWVHRGYGHVRDVCWRYPRVLAAAAVLSLAGAAALYTQIGKTFMPTLDEGDILVQIQKEPSVSLEASVELDTRVQQAILAQVPEVKAIVARAGSDELGLDPMGLDDTDSFLVLKPREQWRGDKDAIIEALRQVLEAFPGLVYTFTQPIEMRVSEMLTGTRGDVAIKLFGNDLDALNTTAQQIAETVEKVAGAAEVVAPRKEGMRYLTLQLNRHAIGQAGLSVESVQQALKRQIEGETVGVVLEGGIRTPLTLRGNDAIRNSPEALRNLPITAPDGKVWSAAALARFTPVDGPIRIDHEQGRRLAMIQVSVEGRDLSGFVTEAQQAVSKLPLPKDIQIVWGGQFENQQRAAARLGIVIPAAMALIFAILSLTFGSARQAAVIFVNIPFALVGGVAALAVSGQYLSVPASVGFIALLGIAVLNGVVMVTHFNERLQMGEAIDTVVLQGTERRLRPVLMTAIITALGMIPLLFASGPGSEIQKPLAIVVTGGLVSSTLLTLLLLPLIFARWGAGKAAADPGGVARAAGLILVLATVFGTSDNAWAQTHTAEPAPAPLITPLAAPLINPSIAPLLPLLPDAERVRQTLLNLPAVQAASAQKQAQMHQAQATQVGAAETSLRLQQQMRRAQSPAERFAEMTVSAERPIRAWGKAQLDAQLAEQQRSLANTGYDDALHEAGRTLLLHWFALHSALLEQQTAATNLRLADELQRHTQTRFKHGDVSQLDARLADAERQRADAALQLAHAQTQAAQAQWTRSYPELADLATRAISPTTASIDASKQNWAMPGQVDALRTEYLADNHELKLLRADAQRLRALAHRLERDRLPDPTIGLYASRDRSGAEHVLGVAVGINLPGPARRANAQAAVAEAQAADDRLRQRERELSAAFDARWLQLQHQQQALRGLTQAARTQTQAAESSFKAYTLGEHSMTDVIQNRRFANEQRRDAGRLGLEIAAGLAGLALDLHWLGYRMQ